MIQCRLAHLEQRCRERGYTMDEVRACIVAQDGSRITVDETRSAYPRPTLVQKAANLTKAAARHVANRGRQCTDEEIAARYAICESCPLLMDEHCTHKNCGCRISPKRAIVSKLSWASESCPVGKWAAVDS
jgi:hypothetical protein